MISLTSTHFLSSIACNLFGEVDTRFPYCAMDALYLSGMIHLLNKEKIVAYKNLYNDLHIYCVYIMQLSIANTPIGTHPDVCRSWAVIG